MATDVMAWCDAHPLPLLPRAVEAMTAAERTALARDLLEQLDGLLEETERRSWNRVPSYGFSVHRLTDADAHERLGLLAFALDLTPAQTLTCNPRWPMGESLERLVEQALRRDEAWRRRLVGLMASQRVMSGSQAELMIRVFLSLPADEPLPAGRWYLSHWMWVCATDPQPGRRWCEQFVAALEARNTLHSQFGGSFDDIRPKVTAWLRPANSTCRPS